MFSRHRRKRIPPPTPEMIRDARAMLGSEVAAGFRSPEEMITSVLECFEDEADPAALRPHLETHLHGALAAHRAAQAFWPETTDCDRLDAAFAELESRGILARQNYLCCGTCGCAAIADEMSKAGAQVRGYTFYHEQDTESAVEGYGVYLNYGAANHDDGPEAAVEIGEEIRDTLERHGLRVDWDGTIEERIAVALDWKRRAAQRG
ncbi:MAG: hypothetical protein IT431_11895 [Phycisphaerales bacterium]|nr:hypothetical protein [Phycisphaerales bacterium]